MSGESLPPIIAQLDNVEKVYRINGQPVVALKGVSVSFRESSFWAIMGPSGSGKSTMLNILGCLDRPTKGRYLLEGRDVSTVDDDELSEIRLRRLGFIFQGFNLIPQLTVRENIELPLYYLGWDHSRASARAEELAEILGLSDRLRHRPSELSGGQQQRVAIARALSNNPAILLADEPTGNLDTATGEEILRLLVELNQQGKTIIMVTHESHIAVFARSKIHLRDGVIERVEEG